MRFLAAFLVFATFLSGSRIVLGDIEFWRWVVAVALIGTGTICYDALMEKKR